MALIDGKAVSAKIRAELKTRIEQAKALLKAPIGLAVVLVGDDPASKVYTTNKVKACHEVGIDSYMFDFPADTDEQTVLELIDKLNADTTVNGILVQLPLPKHLDQTKILERISVAKDVDGFSAYQNGKLMQGQAELVACTPHGVMTLLSEYGIDLCGKHCVVVGRSNIVGKPLALLMLAKNATVTVCHSKTADLSAITKQADILAVAIGKPKAITADMVKDGAVVIDVGINRTANGLCGDVDFEEVQKKASYITPVPGGVGPMTITMLMENTLIAYTKQNGR